MSRLAPNQLTVKKLDSLKEGSYADGGNLWITVTKRSRIWSLRYKSPLTGKRREMGLGPARDVTLARARDLAEAARKLLRDGVDPIDFREQQKSAQAAKVVRTFESVALLYIEDQKAGWRDPRSEPVWTSSLKRLAYPELGKKAIETIETDHVLKVIRPIWSTKTETADRLRGRIERIIDYASTHGWRSGENPARWRGHLANILPKRSSVVAVEHHAAAGWKDIGKIMAGLGRSKGLAALAVRFACLTAARSGEVRGARWSEIDLKAKVWVIPPERMKAKKEHRVPLSAAALAILESSKLPKPVKDGLVFPGGRSKALSDVGLLKALHLGADTKTVTVHGLRSTFRDWVSENTEYGHDAAEMALAHSIGDKVEAAYRRGDLFEKRREMMEMWGVWCSREPPSCP